ncbi:MAG TPA: substrate-binding domain-containing protein [Epulopiscium sp.]|nr:substrate-binding domain-containing protein [Candidatus Epulonipiscium sp.]
MKKRFKRFYSLILINTIIIFNISSCIGYNEIPEELEQTKKQIKIGIAIYDAQDSFIHSVYEMIRQYANQEEAVGAVEITLELVDAQNNQQIQNGQIEAFINEDYDAIAVNIVDRAQAATIINKAQKAKIPLVFFNREPVPQDMAIWENVYYVGAKAEQSGKLQAELLMSAIDQGLEVDTNGDGIIQYVMLEGEPGHQDAILRTYYSIKVLEENNYKIENIASDTGMWRKEESKEKMFQWIEEFGETIEVVLANNDAMALGAIEALEEKGYFNKKNKVQVIGVDGMEEAIKAIKEEKMLGTVFNNGDKQAEAILAKIYTMVMEKEPQTMINAEYEKKCYHTDYGIMDKNYLNK